MSDLYEEARKPERFFEFMRLGLLAEAEMSDKLFDIFGCPDKEDYWFFDDITYDDYDSSFELKQVDPKFTPTQEQLKECWALGFSRCWICYTDGSEKYYYKKQG